MEKEPLPTSEAPMQIFRVQKSRWFLIAPMVLLITAGLLLLLGLILFNPGQSVNVWIQFGAFIIGLAAFSIGALVIWLDWNNTYYILTSQTVERLSGFISKNRTYMSLYDLSKIECRIGIMGRLFNFGTVVLESETTELPLYIVGIDSPYQIIDLVRSARARVSTEQRPK